MQLKRNYFHRLKVEIKIYEYNFITRHAYNQTDLVVKTSHPQIFKELSANVVQKREIREEKSDFFS